MKDRQWKWLLKALGLVLVVGGLWLVAPLEKRVEHARQFYSLTESEAQKYCVNQDRARERYFKKYFNADVNDPLLYHLVVNTGRVSYDEAAKLIGEAALNSHPD